ncbi:uncharacterized protein LOC117827349 [Notolabrus celidotus]|uniref:uncharacterized protein LOC117827349 n=1 Tax=Notolabrus celidotus TaxID=1203425 RepID=UPI00148FDBC4|nr:uncharacterized protein LOC117827349 [Notolabrus celidotus]XP_034559813.1 uncharacterized protein LOC117827349 [Notolabrus celidotus]XP_034559821.1 uncharacterized protein LOC117827349 [Notolabrus celidotus]
MKRRCVPLRADHNLLTPDSHTQSGVGLPPAIQVKFGALASSPEHLSDSSSSESAVRRSQRRHPPLTSLPRRLRFEDETEMEAESRYLERQCQRRGSAQRGTGVLVSKPDLNLYLNGTTMTGPLRARPVGEGHQKGQLSGGQVGQYDSCWTVLGGGVNLNLSLHPSVPEEQGGRLYRPRLKLRTEPIRETYIGSVTCSEPCQGGDKVGHLTKNQVRRRTNLAEVNGNQVSISQATPTTGLPINPYAPNQLTTPSQPSDCPLPTFACNRTSSPPHVTSVMVTQSIKLSNTKVRKNQHLDMNLNQNQERNKNQKKNQSQEVQGKLSEPHRELCLGTELKGRSRCKEVKTKSSSPFSLARKSSAESHAPPTSESSSSRQFRQPMRSEYQVDDTSLPEHSMTRDEPARLSLRKLFANVKLNRTRASSLDRLSSRSCPSPPFRSHPEPAPSSSGMSSSLLKKSPSVQSLSVGAPFLPLRKSSSVQSLRSELKKKKDRSADYRPAADQCMQRCFSIEDVGFPSSVRSVGRVLQACSDGTILIEISRPKDRMFGFIISRGKGRPDSGVYVEDMVDCSTLKLYSGLLGVGDEILEVNGEKVACLTLDQVTNLLIQKTTTTIRVLRQH